jgi:hypothetical protein
MDQQLRSELPLDAGLPDRDQFLAHFGTEERCSAYVFSLRFNEDFSCPTCDSPVFRFLEPHRADCANEDCRFHISLTAGSIFHGTRHGLVRWFKAAFYLITIEDLSARRLAGLINVTYKTAWLWAHKLRHVAASLLGGTRLRAKPRPYWPQSRLQDADFADPATCDPGRWAAFCAARGGPRPPETDPRTPAARRFLLAIASGNVSDVYLPVYLDQRAYLDCFGDRWTAFARLALALPHARRWTYRDLVGPRVARPWLVLAGVPFNNGWGPRARPIGG